MPEFRARLSIVGLTAIFIGLVSSIIPLTIYAQQQGTSFVATLSGKNMVPTVNTAATGTAKLHVNSNGTVSYEVDVMNINGVISAKVGLKNGTELVDLSNPYASVNHLPVFPTGQVSGVLTNGVITGNGTSLLLGPLIGKSVGDLVNLMKQKSTYVIIRTTANQHGEIQGQIVPSS
jgi:hypothetical protein